MRILVVGGGTAGLVAATVLKKRLNVQVDIVRSKDIGIVGVGEGSTEHFREYLDFVGISYYELLKKTNATFKSGIMFENWSDRTYLHSVNSSFHDTYAGYPYIYAHQIAKGSHHISPNILWESCIDRYFVNKPDEYPFNQFHFNTNMLNEFLTDFAKNIGCDFYEDEITNVLVNESGNIYSVVGKKQNYDYDFYIDSTGFKRALIEKLGPSWKSFNKHLKMNSAITFQTPNNEDVINLWTLSRAMNSGWMFKIPTWDHIGIGYVYNDDYIDEEGAKKELEDHLGHEIKVAKRFSFDPGYLENPWINNCVAIGLSSSFVEPLEATSIGTSIQQSFLLMHNILNYDKKNIQSYNKSFVKIMENIRDFISLHYISNREDTQFWKENKKNLCLPDSLSNNLEKWQKHMPMPEDFCEDSNFSLFGCSNYIMVMEGLDLFDRDSIKKEFEMLEFGVQEAARQRVEGEQKFHLMINKISHKKFIELTRNFF